MMPRKTYDYESTDTLSRILGDYRLRPTKYSGRRQKQVKIALPAHHILKPRNVFHASASFLQMLSEKYGAKTTFADALAQWEGQ